MYLHTITDIVFKPEQLGVQKQNILNLLGYGHETEDEHVNGIIENCLAESFKVLKPKGGFLVLRTNKVVLAEGKIFIENQEFQIDKIIASQFRQAEYVALFICTIGKGVEQLSKEYMDRGDLLEGYIFDLIASEAAESMAELIHQSIKAEVALKGLNITNRFSPGYCNWSVKEQFKLFSFFPDGYCGIKLTASALMNPVKSVSGIIGVGKQVKFKPYTCSMCSDENCIYRNRKKYK